MRSHFHGTSTQLMTDAENIITDIPANFVEVKKTHTVQQTECRHRPKDEIEPPALGREDFCCGVH